MEGDWELDRHYKVSSNFLLSEKKSDTCNYDGTIEGSGLICGSGY